MKVITLKNVFAFLKIQLNLCACKDVKDSGKGGMPKQTLIPHAVTIIVLGFPYC